jgi:3'(2'), 5'-bisphosphate nucleotidase
MLNEGLLQKAIEAAVEAGKAIREIYETDFSVAKKTDNSPVTEGDMQAHRLILYFLDDTYLPLLSEEGKEVPFEVRRKWEYYWLVDPLDGTKEFVSRNGEFTVNIALIHRDTPVLGVVYAPVPDVLFFAMENIGAFKLHSCSVYNYASLKAILEHSEHIPFIKETDKFVIIASRSHLNEETAAFIKNLEKIQINTEIISAGSSLKFCIVAENKADIYPRFGTTMEWDTAAGHAIVKYAGGKVLQAGNDEELKYNKPDLRNPSFIVSNY